MNHPFILILGFQMRISWWSYMLSSVILKALEIFYDHDCILIRQAKYHIETITWNSYAPKPWHSGQLKVNDY